MPTDSAGPTPTESSLREALATGPSHLREAENRILHVLLAARQVKGSDPRPIASVVSERIRVTRAFGSGSTDLVDAVLVLDLLGACGEPRSDDLFQLWRPFLEGVAAGGYSPNPALFYPRQPAQSAPFRALLSAMRAYSRTELFWCERTGIPRRWLMDAHGVSRLRIAQYIATAMGGFRPVWQTHLPPLPPETHLTETAYVRSHLEIARMLQQGPSIRGIASSSWYYDPDVARVSPHLGYISTLLAENGCLCFEVPIDDAMRENALRTSRRRQEAHRRGEYAPRAYARLWNRAAILRWAEKQPYQLALRAVGG